MDNKYVQKIALFILFLAVASLFFRVFYPFLFSLFWAAILAGIFYPLYKAITGKINNKNLSASIVLVIILILIILPLALISGIIAKESVVLFDALNNQNTIAEIKSFVDKTSKLPVLQTLTENINIEEEVKNISSAIASIVLNWLKSWTQNAALLIVNLFVMFYALYYFLKDGKKFLLYLMRLLPIGDNIEKTFYEKFISTSKATLKGTILIGIIQGIFGGVIIFIVGVPSVFFWTLIMVILSIIPAVGPIIVLLPITIYMFFFGSMWQIAILAVGMIAVSLLDNILRPALVGKDLNMHPLIIFLSTIGGLSLFGISGIVIGPIIASLLISILDIYEQKNQHNY